MKMSNMLKDVEFYYFSGTGNTFLVVKKMKEAFENNGIGVTLHKIEKTNPEDVDLNKTIGLGFPVAELSTYDFVWNFVKSLPRSNGTKVFMVDTLGGFSGGIVGSMRKILEKKGYVPIGAKEIIMPLNIFYIQDEATCKKKVEKGKREAEEYAISLMNGEGKWGRVPVISDAVYYTSIATLKLTHSNIHQKYLRLDMNKEKCSKCGQCADLCPLNNIQMADGEFPVILRNCCYCLSCTSFCPLGAISAPFNYKGKTYRAVKAKEFME